MLMLSFGSAAALEPPAGPVLWAGGAIFLGLIGFWIGLLVDAWKRRTPPLSDADLAAELRGMSLESLREYQALCSPKSREHQLAEAELNRRTRS